MQSLILSGSFDSLDTLSEYVLAVASNAKLDKKATYRLRLAVDEIATNIISYGYEAVGKQGDIHLNADIDDNAVTICLEDTGIPYDPIREGTPDDLDKPLEARKIGGLGVYLAIQGVDRFTYERVGDRNRNILVVYRHLSK